MWRRLQTIGCHPLAIAGLLIAVFIFGLHPATGFVGGLLFFLIAWVVPNAVNFLVSYWAVNLFPFHILTKIPLFIAISASFGIAPAVPEFIMLMRQQSQIDYTVMRPSYFHTAPATNVRIFARVPVFAFQLDSEVEVGGNEGCMCYYFELNDAATYGRGVAAYLNAILGGSEAVVDYHFSPASNARFQYLVLRVEDAHSQNPVLVLDVFDGQEKTATFRQRGIPTENFRWPTGLGQRNFGTDFYTHAVGIILRDSFWTHVLRPYVASYFPRTQIAEFLHSAVRLGGSVSPTRPDNAFNERR